MPMFVRWPQIALFLTVVTGCSDPKSEEITSDAQPQTMFDAGLPECNLPTELSWQPVASAPISREETQALAVGRKLYIFGGYVANLEVTEEAWAYDIDSDEWTRLADVPDKITHAGQATDGSSIYLVGAFLGDGLGPSTTQSWIYDIADDSWRDGPPLPEPRGGGALARLGKSLHYFGGGQRPSVGGPIEVDLADHLVLDLEQMNNGWKDAPLFPNPRNHLGATVLAGAAYAIGGQHGDEEVLGNQASVHVFGNGNGWQSRADMPRGLGHNAAATVSAWGCAIVLGGTANRLGNINNVVAYSPDTDSWTELTPLPMAGRVSAGVVGDRIIAVVGNQTWISDGG